MLKRLTTPIHIQDFLNSIPINWEKAGDTHFSPRSVLHNRRAHCIEGALLAATALWIHGEPPIIMDLLTRDKTGDDDHVIALYKRDGYYGAISKSNHATIRFRDPIFRTVRELALSYFHEWFLNSTGEKTLDRYSNPFDMRQLGTAWITAEQDLWNVSEALDAVPHHALVPKRNWRYVRYADPIEIQSGSLIEWRKTDPRT